jgi:hypothetical protein
VSRISLFYFCTALGYCITQLVFQSWAFKINNDAGIRLASIIDASTIVADVVVVSLDNQLRVCQLNDGMDIRDCPIAPDGSIKNLLNHTVQPTSTTPASLQDHVATTTTLTSTPTSSTASTSTSSKSSSVRPTPSVRSTGSVVFLHIPIKHGDDDHDDHDRDETEHSNVRTVVKFTKRDEGIIRVNKNNVTGVFVPDIVVKGQPGVVLDDSCVEVLVWPSLT